MSDTAYTPGTAFYGQRLWLWQNSAEGLLQYVAYLSAWPIGVDHDDPITFGSPVGWAELLPCRDGSDGRTTERVEAEIAALTPANHHNELVEALEALLSCLNPIQMQLAQDEMAGKSPDRSAVFFSFMGSSGSDQVTVGEYTDTIENARKALARVKGGAS